MSARPPFDSLRRRPFAAADADAVMAFCAAHAAGDHDAGLVRTLLLDLTSDPAGVIVVDDAGGIVLVATVIDRIRNGADAANLEILGVRAAPAAASFIRLVVEPAVAFARAGERRALQVGLPPSLARVDGIEDALAGAGFAHAYDSFEMRRPAAAPAAAAAALPPGWSWAAVDVARADAAHAVLVEMFRDAPGTSVMPLADFKRAVGSGAGRWRALLDDGDRIAGIVRVAMHGGQGQVRILGRMPAYRGRGLGAHLMAEGLRELAAAGAGDVDLSVEAANERALDLYRRFGFEIVAPTPVFARALRG
jgi:ribosomal protein S18 acetylase RimI-like enzyme